MNSKSRVLRTRLCQAIAAIVLPAALGMFAVPRTSFAQEPPEGCDRGVTTSDESLTSCPKQGGNGLLVAAGAIVIIGVAAGATFAQGALTDAWNWFSGLFSDDPEPSSPPPPQVSNEVKFTTAGHADGAILGRGFEQRVQPSLQSIPLPLSPVAVPSVMSPPSLQGADALRPDIHAPSIPASDPGSVRANTDPISLRRGEFVHVSTDQETLGLPPALTLVRTYRSHVDFVGPLGPAWDHNLNARIYLDGDSSLCGRELVVSLGDLRRIAVRPASKAASPSTPVGIVYRPVDSGLHFELSRHSNVFIEEDNWCLWDLRFPDGRSYCFDQGGYITRIRTAGRNFVWVIWEQVPGSEERRVSEARRSFGGEITHTLRFIYEDDGTHLAATTLYAGDKRVNTTAYIYENGALASVRQEDNLRESYTYAPLPAEVGRKIPLEGLNEYCDAVCAPYQPRGCGTLETICAKAASNTRATCGQQCQTNCGAACDAAFAREAAQACADGPPTCAQIAADGRSSYRAGCVATCTPRCTSDCERADLDALVRSCEAPCHTQCMKLASDAGLYIYGQPSDLRYNLENIVDGAGKRVVHNVYGQDPRSPSFDAVIEQSTDAGSVATKLTYIDLDPPRPPSTAIVPKSTVARPLAFDRIVSSSDQDSSAAAALVTKSNAPDGTLQICGQPATAAKIYLTPFAEGRGVYVLGGPPPAPAFRGVPLAQSSIPPPSASPSTPVVRTSSASPATDVSFLLQVSPTGTLIPRGGGVTPGTRIEWDGSYASLAAASDGSVALANLHHRELLIARKRYEPSRHENDERTFKSPFAFKIPADAVVTQGNAGNHRITLRYKETPNACEVRCQWRGGSDQAHPRGFAQINRGLAYSRFLGCSNGARVGSTVKATWLKLTVEDGDCRAPGKMTEAIMGLDGSSPKPSDFLDAVGAAPGNIIAFGSVDGAVQPVGVVQAAAALTRGVCRSAFSLAPTTEGTLTMDPPGACEGDLRIVPLAAMDEGAASILASAGFANHSSMDLERYGAFAPSAWRFHPRSGAAIDPFDWAEAMGAIHAESGLLPTLTSLQRTLLAPRIPLNFTELDLISSKAREIGDQGSPDLRDFVKGQLALIRGESEEHDLFRDGGDFLAPARSRIFERIGIAPVASTPSSEARCDPIPYAQPFSGTPSELRRGRWATWAAATDREILVSYYNDRGDNVRVVNVTRGIADEFEYDEHHNRVGFLRRRSGSLVAAEPRVCSSFNDDGAPTSVTRFATDRPESSQQCASYDDRASWLTAVTEPNAPSSRQMARTYDFDGNITEETNGAGEKRAFTYDESGRLLRVVDPERSTALTDHDVATGWPKTVTVDTSGVNQVETFTFDSFGHLSQVDRHGAGTREEWDWFDRSRLHRHRVVTGEGTDETTYDYYDNGQLLSIRDEIGTRGFDYDAGGRLWRFRDYSGSSSRTTCFRRRSDGSVRELVDPNGAAWTETRTYQDNGARTTSTSVSVNADPACALPHANTGGAMPSGIVGSMTIDAAGHVVRRVSPDGIASSTSYDRFGRPFVTEVGSTEKVRSASYYDLSDRMTARVVFSNGAQPIPVQFTEADVASRTDLQLAFFAQWDGAGRAKRLTSYARHPTAGVEMTSDREIAIDRAVRSSTETDHTSAGDWVTTIQSDGIGRIRSMADNSGRQTTLQYDAPLQRTISAVGPDGRAKVRVETLTSRGAIATVRDGSGKLLESREYDVLGRLKTVENEANGITTLAYGVFNQLEAVDRLIRRDGAMLEHEEHSFGDRGQLDAVFNGQREAMRYVYDPLGRVARETRPSASGGPGEWTFGYVGGSSKVAAARTPARSYTYDYDAERGFLRRVTASAEDNLGSTGDATERVSIDEVTWQGQPSVLSLLGADGVVRSKLTLARDGSGRVVSEHLQALFGPAELDVTSTRRYAKGGALRHRSIAAQGFTYAPRIDGRAASIVRDDTGAVLASYDYGGEGVARAMTLGNGVTETREFDERGRVLAQRFGDAVHLEYGYGADGGLRRVTARQGADRESTLLALDTAGRISDELDAVPVDVGSLSSGAIDNAAVLAFSASAPKVRTYTLDTGNNWTRVAGNDFNYEPSPGASSAYAATPEGSASYDLDGRLIGSGDRQFRYDAWGRLARVTGAGADCAYEYDAAGRRIRESCNGATTAFAYDGDSVVLEKSGGVSTLTVHQADSSSPLVRIGGSSVVYLAADSAGSIRATLNDSGQVLERASYSAYGETSITKVAGSTSNRFGFQGLIYDPVTQLYDMRERFYSPSWGRFLTPDPIGWRGGANLYAFVGNRPHAFSDPWGLSPIGRSGSGGAGGAGGAGFGSLPYGLTGQLGSEPGVPGTSLADDLYVGFVSGLNHVVIDTIQVANTAVYGTTGPIGWARAQEQNASFEQYRFPTYNLTQQAVATGVPFLLPVGEIGEAVAGGSQLAQIAADTSALARASRIAEGVAELEAVGQGAGFGSFSSFKNAVGPAGEGLQWHHIAEQTAGNVGRFGSEAIHNTGNLIRLETGVHRELSGFYSSIQPQVTGSTSLTVRGWLAPQSLSAQQEFGRQILLQLGVSF